MKNRMAWTFTITSIALFMVTLDNLVITTAIPVIRTHLHASLSGQESRSAGHGAATSLTAMDFTIYLTCLPHDGRVDVTHDFEE